MRAVHADLSWEDPALIPKDGTAVEVIFIDHKGEYPGFKVFLDTRDRIWRNAKCRTEIRGTISGWRR